MDYYFLKDDQRYVATQGEAIKSKQPWEKVEIPTDKKGLLAWANDKEAEVRSYKRLFEMKPSEPCPESQATSTPSEPETAPQRAPAPDFSAKAVLSRMDNPGTDVDTICETIGKAKGYALQRYAGCVAVAFQALESKRA